MDDDDKSIIEKTIERVKDIAAKASEKAHKAMEREPIKPGDEVVMMSEAAPIGDPVMPPFVIIPGRNLDRRRGPALGDHRKISPALMFPLSISLLKGWSR